VAVLVGSVVGAPVVLAAPASAASVTTEADLRAAWAADSTVSLGASITLTDCSPAGGELLRSDPSDLSVEGNGFTITQTCPGARVAETAGGTLTLADVTLTGGDLVADTGSDVGGGAIRAGGALVATRITVDGNAVSAGADVAFASGGGLWVAGLLTLRQSTVSDNRVTAGGSPGLAAGGGIYTVGGSINASTIARNAVQGSTAALGGGIEMGSSFSAPLVGPLTITNSTVSNNVAEASSGATFGGGITTSTRVHVIYTTIADNAARTGANVSADLTNPFRSGEVDATASVIASPQSGGANCFFPKGASILAYSWVTDGSCAGAPGPTTVVNGADPELGALAENGGPTSTMLPAPSSPLLDRIPLDACASGGVAEMTSDQRGIARPQGAACDIGAVEVSAGTPVALPTPLPVAALPAFTG
jgi:hypothetical protein